MKRCGAVDGSKRPKTIILCGTYGCTKPNNHRGLHAIPIQTDSSRGRRGGGARVSSRGQGEVPSRSPSRSAAPAPPSRDAKSPLNVPPEASKPVSEPVGATQQAVAAETEPLHEEDEVAPPERKALAARADVRREPRPSQRIDNYPGARQPRCPSAASALARTGKARPTRENAHSVAWPSRHMPTPAICARASASAASSLFPLAPATRAALALVRRPRQRRNRAKTRRIRRPAHNGPRRGRGCAFAGGHGPDAGQPLSLGKPLPLPPHVHVRPRQEAPGPLPPRLAVRPSGRADPCAVGRVHDAISAHAAGKSLRAAENS